MANSREVVLAVMADVQGLAKKDRNDHQKFNFRGIDAVMNAVGPALRKAGGFISPFVDRAEYVTVPSKAGGSMVNARLVVTFSVYGSEGEPITGTVAAEAFDSGDKATAKAMSVAYRTFLLQLLCLPTDEPDPDSFTYEIASREWLKEAEALALTYNLDALRILYADAQAANAGKDVLDSIKGWADVAGKS